MTYYFKRISLFLVIYVAVNLVFNVLLTVLEFSNLDTSVWALTKTFTVSVWFMLMEFCFLIIPFVFYLWVFPAKRQNSKLDKCLTGGYFILFVYLVLFKVISEYFFWDEFASRFNFIAVDYLIYTQEVIANITQSYPMVPIFSGVLALSLIIWFFFRRKFTVPGARVPGWKKRASIFVGLLFVCGLIVATSRPQWSEVTSNRYNNEIALGGTYGFGYAFFHNEIDYDTFYITQQDVDVSAATGAVAAGGRSVQERIGKQVAAAKPEVKANVMFVLMESMGLRFLPEGKEFWEPQTTPHLQQLAKEGIYFPNTFSTGTRTVRGIEATTLGIPPLPGMSIVRRKGNENIRNIGDMFRTRGYKTKFIYGGLGYFDNMNYFFAQNGFEAIDRSDMPKEEVTFANAWGVADEDLFARAIKEADASYKAKQPFFNYILTTSNHRPYTYPDARVEIPSGTSRYGAVQYSDYAIGQFVAAARKKPWFDNTVFVFVADHGPGSSGKQELAPREHRIPFIVYAPKLLKSKRYEQIISQIDVPPTLLSLLGLGYENHFFGSDATAKGYKSRYFLNNYQKIGYVENDVMTVLKPVKEVEFYKGSSLDAQKDKATYQAYLNEAVGYYQGANEWKKYLRK